MPITLPEIEALPVGPTIELQMRGGAVAFTSLTPMADNSFGGNFRSNSPYLYPRMAFIDETTPLQISPRDSGASNEALTVNGVSELIHGTSITFPLGGTPQDPFFWFGGAGFNITSNEWWVSRGGSTGNFEGSDGQHYRGILMDLIRIAFPSNANTTGFITVSEDAFGGDDYDGPFPAPVASTSNNAQFSELWNLDLDNTIKLADGDLFLPGNYDYYAFKTDAAKDPAGTRNRWQAIRYYLADDNYEAYSLLNVDSSVFPVPGPSARYTLLAYNQETLGDELALVFVMGQAVSEGGGLTDTQTVYVRTTPAPAYDCGVVTTLTELPPIAVTNSGVATIDDCFTPVLDGLNMNFATIQGCPEGFLVYNYFDPYTFYIVDRTWTNYQKYEIIKADTLACNAHASLSESRRGSIHWCSADTYILVMDTGTATLNRLREGAPSMSWGGCIHEGGTGEGSAPPGPPINGPPFDPAVQAHVSTNITLDASALDVNFNNPEPQE